jgi:hypothetical protein
VIKIAIEAVIATELMSMIEMNLKGCGARATGTGHKIAAIAPTDLCDKVIDGNGATFQPSLGYFPLY